MTEAVRVVAPLRLEARATNGTRIGLRARRIPAGDEPLALAGVAGAVTDGLSPGDLVVADRILYGDDRELVLPSAKALASALRIGGLRVQVGAIGGASAVVTGDARTAWAQRGAIAVDMESGVLAATGRLVAVVRAIVDTPIHPLVSAGTLPRGARALRSLRRAAPVLSAWAAGQGEPDIRERQASVVDITITLPGEVENS